MGICLDTDQTNGSQVFEEGDARSVGRWRGEAGLLATPPDGHFPMQNVGPVKFEAPKVPVIFVLGGPGSGKVTHCDNLMQEKKGITHINMTDLLQQYALGNDMQDFGLLSSKTVAEVLMLEMKMSPGAKTFLISGYPRNMRDVVEYSEKIQIVNGVVLVSWRQEVLERQIDYGAQLGHVILGLARMELRNFYRNVMPVAEYFDRSGILLEVNGERNPNEVYVDFRDVVMRILGLSQGSSLRDKGPQRSLEAEVEVERRAVASDSPSPEQISPLNGPLPDRGDQAKTANNRRKGIPSFIWVIGGPGSNKAVLCKLAVQNMPGWVHVSVGGLLRSMASTNTVINESLMSGEMTPRDIVMRLIEQQVLLNRDNDGIVLEGFPRDLNQLEEFQTTFGQKPQLLLLDCSKLQLGRGRADDSVTAFRKRLEIFREISLPMLKTLESDNRLTIIDGDTDVPSVQQECAAALYQMSKHTGRELEVQMDTKNAAAEEISPTKIPNSIAPGNKANGAQRLPVGNGVAKRIVENGLDPTNRFEKPIGKKNASKRLNGIANNVRMQNGAVKQFTQQNGAANGVHNLIQNGVGHLANGVVHNGNRVAPLNANHDPVRNMYNEVEGYRQDLHI